VAAVSWAESEPTHLTRFNGKRAVFVTFTVKDGADVARAIDTAQTTLDAFERTLPAG
jgi:multidrug efflux pump subunit AcrB